MANTILSPSKRLNIVDQANTYSRGPSGHLQFVGLDVMAYFTFRGGGGGGTPYDGQCRYMLGGLDPHFRAWLDPLDPILTGHDRSCIAVNVYRRLIDGNYLVN